MNINCLHCGHKFDLGHACDDYEGLVRCSTCGGLLEIKTQGGAVKSMRFGSVPTASQPAEQSDIVIQQSEPGSNDAARAA